MSIKTSHRTGSTISGNVELSYRRFGHPGETPVLVVSGNSNCSDGWADVASEISEDRVVVTFEVRGHRKSTTTSAQSLDMRVNDIRNLLDHLGWRTAIVLGNSEGGSLALRFAAEHPERVAGLILVDYSPAQRSDGSGRQIARLRANRRRPAGNGAEWSPTYRPQHPWYSLAAVEAPVLVVWATRSTIYDEETLARVCTVALDATVAELDCGHDVLAQAPAELADAIRGFLPWI